MIRILSEQTINQIAAGEVIENPASVVKELVENALDAGALQIIIEISAGGMQLIRISDNGCGMNREDALLSLKRHATSKIIEAKDLFQLSTLGFRGEALASIAAISHLTLFTAQDGGEGTKIEIDGAGVPVTELFARTKGTTIEVRSLFYNVPVRKKFQKSTPVSASEIFRLITIFALSHPEVEFELISNGKKTVSTFAGEHSLTGRAASLLGEEYVSSSCKMQFAHGALRFEGILGSPTYARPTKTGQFLFINRRAVICPLIQETIKEAYGTRISTHRHPIYLLHLAIPADLVDVNVHPQKKEIRLRDERYFKEKIQEAVHLSFGQLTVAATSAPVNFIQEEAYPFSTIQENFLSLRFKEEETAEQTLPIKSQDYKPVGLFSHYLFLEGWSVDPKYDGLLLVDLKAALWRVAFDASLEHRKVQKEKQGLIVPYTITFSSIESAMVLTHLSTIESLGFSLRPIGRDVFIVEAVPSYLNEMRAKETLTEIAHELQSFIGKPFPEEKKQEQLAYIVSCRCKEKKQYSLEEALLLFKELLGSSSPYLSPKGNPIMVHLDSYEINQLFSK